MKTASGRILYIGKAQNLKARVGQYFGKSSDERPSIPFLISKTENLEWMVTNTEKEALLLENTLIKKHSPRYNVRLSDDKTFLSLRINLKEDFPRVEVTRIRSKPKDGAAYFGPYSSAIAIRQTLKQLQKLFPLRTCSNIKMYRQKKRPCLDYQIDRCLGPCVGLISKEDYRKIVEDVILFLRGRSTELVEKLDKKMRIQADQLKFEDAQKIRDAIEAIKKSVEKQQVFSIRWANQDVYGLHREGDELELAVMHIRDGLLNDSTTEEFSGVMLSDEELIGGFISQMYEVGKYIPKEIIIPVELSDVGVREEILSERRGGSVKIIAPLRGEKLGLIRMASKNAESAFVLKRDREQMAIHSIEEMQKKLRLKRLPRRIECFDISTIRGSLAVGSMVTFTDGRPDKSEYRKYRIKTVSGLDDYGMMREVIQRRVRRGKEEGKLPDLIIVDGGKGQLNIASTVLSELGVAEIDLISIAKDKSAWAEKKIEVEKVYIVNVKGTVRFRRNSPVLFLIQQIRNEAHRFAITYHRKLRNKSVLKSVLDDIRGIGPKRKKALLNAFGSIKRIREASVEELSRVKGMSRRTAEQLREKLNVNREVNDRENI